AVLEIELAQQFAVEIEAVWVVDIGALEEAQQIGLRGADHVTELRIAERDVADEIDGANLGGGSLIDLEDHVDSVVWLVNDFGIDLRRVQALATINVKDALYVRLHPGTGVDSA